MPAPSSFDLAKLDSWCGCRPGMTRAQVTAALQAEGVEAEAYGENNLTATEDEWELEFHFATDGSERLRQLSLDGEEVLWAGQPLVGIPLDEALRMMAPRGSALWTAYDAVGSPFPVPLTAPPPPVTDEQLLQEGTIWLPERGLGLGIFEGSVSGVAWRGSQDMPAQFAGPVTDAQRELSRRPDLTDFLREKEMRRTAAAIPKDPMRFLRGALTLAALAALALTGREGFKEMQLWAQAPVLKARLLGSERGPMKQFLEYLPAPVTKHLPQWLLAGRRSGVPPQTDLYRVEFTDPHGRQRRARLEQAEFYVPPREAGEEVEVVYVDGDPPRVKGPARARDSAFIEHVPWAIAIGAVWLIAQFALSILPSALRLLGPLIRRLVPTGTTIDPDRPELR